jgi:hypothetical protein
VSHTINKVWQTVNVAKNQIQVKQLMVAKVWLSELWLKTKQVMNVIKNHLVVLN